MSGHIASDTTIFSPDERCTSLLLKQAGIPQVLEYTQ